MKKLIINLLAIVCLSSCCDNTPEKPELTPEQKTAESFKNPVTVGTLPDGRVISKVQLHYNSYYVIDIFILGNSASYEVPNGKYKKPAAVIEALPKE